YADKSKNRVIDQPCVSLYGTTVPEHFFQSLTTENLSDGFIARLLAFEADTTPPRQRPPLQEVPDSILKAARWWGDFRPGGNLRNEHPNPLIVYYDHNAEAIFDEFARLIDGELAKAGADGRALWARAEEKACRLALVHACSAARDSPVIAGPAARW